MTVKEFKEQVTLTTSGGGCLNGRILVSFAKLVRLLGEPNSNNDGYKTDAEWAVSFKGETFAIYNYKDGKNYNGKGGLDIEQLMDWHIGGNDKVVANELIELIKSVY